MMSNQSESIVGRCGQQEGKKRKERERDKDALNCENTNARIPNVAKNTATLKSNTSRVTISIVVVMVVVVMVWDGGGSYGGGGDDDGSGGGGPVMVVVWRGGRW